MTDHIELSELDQAGVVCRLTPDQAAALGSLNLVELRALPGGEWRLLPNGRVGAARVGGLEIRVRPKVGIARLLFLLGYARDPGFRPEDVAAVAEPDLWPALADAIARHAERALRRGLLQGYVTVDEALPLVRGRVRLADQIARRPGGLVPLEVRYDDYAVDIVENRLLRTAVRRMMTVPGVSSDVTARLIHLDARLSGAQVLPAGSAIPRWRPTRLNLRYAPALRLADLVLRHQSTEIGPGGVEVAAFVVDMAAVFESFLTTALREAFAGYPGYTEAQRESPLDSMGRLTIRPDVVQIVDRRPVAVLDAKYKLSTGGRYGNADTYQMLTYCTVLELTRGWLVYAEGASGSTVHRVRNSQIDVIHYPLDLSSPPECLLQQVAELAALAIGA